MNLCQLFGIEKHHEVNVVNKHVTNVFIIAIYIPFISVINTLCSTVYIVSN